MCLLHEVSSADNLSKQFGSRSGLTKRRAWCLDPNCLTLIMLMVIPEIFILKQIYVVLNVPRLRMKRLMIISHHLAEAAK